MTRAIQKILVANRGEIAVRIMRTVKKMGIMTVAVFSDEDANSLHKNLADEAYPIGGGALTGTYLNIDKLIQIAKHSHAGAIHPGYGFLSESPDFALACEQNNIIFIGPSSKVIQLMGNKIEARNIAKEIGIPVTESIEGSQDDLLKKEITIPYPLLIKAAAGGGGKGMKIVNHPAELKENLESASREALNYFGDGTVFIEKYVENPRHIEVQLLADNHGNCIHLFERECSIQRRHQKIIEEAPSPTFTEEVREKITSSAIGIAQKIGYTNAGTIEFLVDKDLNFYFLEMNTRIQVEHPVTEMITGLDIVEEQIEIATGKPLHYKQTDIHSKGHAIECRIYAENPASSFLPSPGEIVLYKTPVYKGIRIDSSIDGQAEIRSEFDPMIAKLISNGTDREDARIKMLKALDGFFLQGIESNISYLKEIMEHQVFIENSISTSFCDVYTSGILSNLNKKKENFPSEIVIGGFLLFELSNQQKNNLWERIGFWRDLMQISLKIDPFPFEVEIKEIKENEVKYVINNLSFKTLLLEHSAGEIKYLVNDRFYHAAFSSKNSYQSFATITGLNFIIERQHVLHSDVLYETSESQHSDSGNMIQAPMFGKLVKISVNEGDLVKKNQTLLVIEAMKMENNIISHKDATVESIHAKAGQMIEINQILISFSE